MNNKANVGIEILILLVTVVLTSGAILFLVNYGFLQVKADGNAADILNVEFIPLGREGYLVVKEFQFCESVDEKLNCVNPKDTFSLGENVYFRFVVESSTYDGQIMVVENYKLSDPEGVVLLDVDEKNNFNFDIKSNKETEDIVFTDYFVVGNAVSLGNYNLQLLLENPLLNKKTSIVEGFEVR